jgi:hypothetical protein
LFDGGGSQDGDILGMLGVSTVRKIQSSYVHARF